MCCLIDISDHSVFCMYFCVHCEYFWTFSVVSFMYLPSKERHDFPKIEIVNNQPQPDPDDETLRR